MKNRTLVLILLIVLAAAGAETHAQPEQSGRTHAAETRTRIFSSNLGFDLAYPAEWTYIDLGPFLPAAKINLDQQAASDPYRRSIECSQNIFTAKLGETDSIFIAGAIGTDCMGETPNLDTFINRTMNSLEGRYQLTNTRIGAYAVEGQKFWIMRSLAESRRDPADKQTIEYVATILPKGLIYWYVHSKNQQAQSGFEHAQLQLTSGVKTELIPEGAFEATGSPDQAFTSLGSTATTVSLIKKDLNASHHFDSGHGFSYEIPQNFMLLDTKQWAAAHHVDANGQPVPDQTPLSHRRQILLVTKPEDDSKLILLTTCTKECLGPQPMAHSMDVFLAMNIVNLARTYTLKDQEFGNFSVGPHSFLCMRSMAAVKKLPWESNIYLAVLITPITDGIAEYFLQGRTRADLDALMATRLKFDDGAETELIPQAAFTAKTPPPQAHPAPEFSEATPLLHEPAPSTLPIAKLDYSAEPIVIEKLDQVDTMAADGTGVRQFTLLARVQSDAGVRQFGVLTLPYASNSEHVELAYIRVRHPDGSVTETPVSTAIEMPSAVTTAAPFYSDLKELQIPVRNLRVGDHLEWQAKIIRTKPEVPGQFWGEETFSTDVVVLAQSLELHVPKDIYINVWSQGDKPAETSSSIERVYRWEFSQKKPTVGPIAEAEKERKKKQLWTAEQEIEAKEGKLPSVAWTTFKDWDAVGAWYRALEGDRAFPNDAEIQSKVAELTAGKTSQEEKVRAVYNYVATQIRYIGVDFGIGRYQPHRAVEVLENQYGDCKDKHTLLAAMLSVLGLHPDAVLIGSGVRFNEAVPAPQSFNHLITRVSVEGQTIWLDSTTEVAPYRVLSYAIRGKAVLIVPDSGVNRIDRTPANLPFPAVDRMDAVGALDDTGTSNSHLVLTLRGDSELQLRSSFHSVSPAQYDQLVQQFSLGMGYAGTTSHAEVSRPEDTEEPLRIAYDYKREKAGDWDHLRIIPQLVPVSLPCPDQGDPPTQAIVLGPPHSEISTSAMKLPEGWTAKFPEAVHVTSPWATYDETYRWEHGTVYAQRTIQVLQESVPVSDWRSYKKFADEAGLGKEAYIQLFR
jgi:hypothetical protein